MATLACRVQFLDDTDPFSCTNLPEPTRPPTYNFSDNVPLIAQLPAVHSLLKAPHQLEDCALQLSHNGTYLDLESTIDEQREEFDVFSSEKKHSILLRTQLSVRVHACIEKLLNSSGRELRRALFSLKQIFQDDKDLVHEFVNNGGLDCLIKVGQNQDQNYQNYILRALGQVMLYVDGMNGVIEHNPTLQWLYSLLSSKFRLVIKTALKLLLVFVEYTETNTLHLLRAVAIIDKQKDSYLGSNVMAVLSEDGADPELLVYAMTLVNKMLNAIPDQDTFYDVTDSLEEQGIDKIIQKHQSKKGSDIDLLEQFQLYELAIKHEDGESDIPAEHLQNFRRRRGTGEGTVRGLSKDRMERRKNRRNSVSDTLDRLSRASSVERINFGTSDSSLNGDGPSSIPHSKSSDLSRKATKPPYPEKEVPSINHLGKEKTAKPEKSEKVQKDKPEDETGPAPAENITSNNDAGTGEDDQKEKDRRARRQARLKRNSIKTDEQQSTNSVQPAPTTGTEEGLPSDILPAATALRNTGPLDTGCNPSYGVDRLSQGDGVGSVVLGDNAQPSDGKALLTSDLDQKASQNRPTPTDYVRPSYRDRSNYTRPSFTDRKSRNRRFSADNVHEIAKYLKRRPLIPQPLTECNEDQKAADGEESLRDVNGIDDNKENFIPAKLPLVEGGMGEEVESGKRNLTFDMLYKQAGITSPGPEETTSPTSAPPPPPVECSETLSERIENLQNKQQEDSNTVSKSEDTSVVSEGTVVETTQKLTTPEEAPQPPVQRKTGDLSGIISRAKESLAKEAAQMDELKSNSISTSQNSQQSPHKDTEANFEQYLLADIKLIIKDLDFTDLIDEDDVDILAPKIAPPLLGGIPPPPPPPGGPPPPPGAPPPPPPPPGAPPPPPPLGSGSLSVPDSGFKKKKTIRLFWKEVKQPPMIPNMLANPSLNGSTVWNKIETVAVSVDTKKLEQLFETKVIETAPKRLEEKKQEVVVLDTKRSNGINIALTSLPAPRIIKAAIMNMDNVAMNKEAVEKLFQLSPTDDEKLKIQEAMAATPEKPLASAEQFLWTMSSISQLKARLNLWYFKLEYEVLEQEIAEPLMDLKNGMVQLKENSTLRCILGTLLAIGNFLNGATSTGFQLDYLAKVPEVKDTVHKQPLIFHLCNMVMEKFPESTDLYSDIGAVTRTARVDFDQLKENLDNLEAHCISNWDNMKAIAKHESNSPLKNKLTQFLADCAERVTVLKVVYRRVLNRFKKMLLYFSVQTQQAGEVKPQMFCKTISEFALEYRTTRERIITLKKKKANHRERNKTRGKLIVESDRFNKKQDDSDKLENILKKPISTADHFEPGSSGTFPGTRLKRVSGTGRSSSPATSSTSLNKEDPSDDGTDEVMDMLVKSATSNSPTTKTAPKERKRLSRYSNRKSLRRTLRCGLSDEEKKQLGIGVVGDVSTL